jgi:hypothetical protein
MRTKTLYYPSVKRPELEVEVTEVGDIVSCLYLIPGFDTWSDLGAMEYLKNRPKLMEDIRCDAACLNWNDHGDDDWSVEGLKRSVAHIIGVKHA